MQNGTEFLSHFIIKTKEIWKDFVTHIEPRCIAFHLLRQKLKYVNINHIFGFWLNCKIVTLFHAITKSCDFKLPTLSVSKEILSNALSFDWLRRLESNQLPLAYETWMQTVTPLRGPLSWNRTSDQYLIKILLYQLSYQRNIVVYCSYRKILRYSHLLTTLLNSCWRIA